MYSILGYEWEWGMGMGMGFGFGGYPIYGL